MKWLIAVILSLALIACVSSPQPPEESNYEVFELGIGASLYVVQDTTRNVVCYVGMQDVSRTAAGVRAIDCIRMEKE